MDTQLPEIRRDDQGDGPEGDLGLSGEYDNKRCYRASSSMGDLSRSQIAGDSLVMSGASSLNSLLLGVANNDYLPPSTGTSVLEQSIKYSRNLSALPAAKHLAFLTGMIPTP